MRRVAETEPDGHLSKATGARYEGSMATPAVGGKSTVAAAATNTTSHLAKTSDLLARVKNALGEEAAGLIKGQKLSWETPLTGMLAEARDAIGHKKGGITRDELVQK